MRDAAVKETEKLHAGSVRGFPQTVRQLDTCGILHQGMPIASIAPFAASEGVEDWETVQQLTELGCDYAQGFVIGRGVTIDELSAMASTSVRKAA